VSIHVYALVRRLPSYAPHAPHAPLTPLPYHFHSAFEFLRAQHALHTEKEKLVHTVRLAELCSMSQKNANAIEEQKRLLALVKTYTLGRQRWITSINRVLVRNSLEKVKTRLLKSKHAGWYKAMAEAKRRSLHISKLQLMRQESASCSCTASPVLSLSKHIDLRCAIPDVPGVCPTIPLGSIERRRESKALQAQQERDSKLGKLSCKPKSASLQPLKAISTKTPTPTLLKSSSLVQRLRTKTATSASELKRFRTANAASASELQRILAPHLFISSQVPERGESLTVKPKLSPVKSPNLHWSS
jgi:hypothetical protein